MATSHRLFSVSNNEIPELTWKYIIVLLAHCWMTKEVKKDILKEAHGLEASVQGCSIHDPRKMWSLTQIFAGSTNIPSLVLEWIIL